MTTDDIHPQLLVDCHVLGELPSGVLLLHRNAALPWLILVPDTEETELLFVEQELRAQIMADAKHVGRHLQEALGCRKVNVAALGNQVPQLHLHLIGRSPGDACWPKPVWGHLEASAEWSEGEIEDFRVKLLAPQGVSFRS